MRWDNLFDDLEGQLEQELSADELDERAEEERLRLGRLSLRERILALHAADDSVALGFVLTSGEVLAVRPTSFGRDWFAAELEEGTHRRSVCIVPLAAVGALLLDRGQVEPSLAEVESASGAASLSARLTLPFVLRDLCRRRASVTLRTPAGDAHGTIDRVGRDHLDLAVHEPGSARRQSSVTQLRVVPLAQLLLVRV
jgi:hypothetical protein